MNETQTKSRMWRERAWDESVNIERIYSLDVISDRLPDDLCEFLKDEFPIKKVFGVMPYDFSNEGDCDESELFDLSDHEFSEVMLEFFADEDIRGLIAEVHTPVMKYNNDGSTGSYSWGHCAALYVHGNTLEELYENAFEEVRKLNERRQQEVQNG